MSDGKKLTKEGVEEVMEKEKEVEEKGSESGGGRQRRGAGEGSGGVRDTMRDEEI